MPGEASCGVSAEPGGLERTRNDQLKRLISVW